MTISDRIFELLEEKDISQRTFSKQTGIPESTISDWRKKSTNPSAAKILAICETLNVTPGWLLSGIEEEGSRAKKSTIITVTKDSEEGKLFTKYSKLNPGDRKKVAEFMKKL